MTSRPILFTGPMVRAILEGRKTQTRRVVKHGKCLAGYVRTLDFQRMFRDTASFRNAADETVKIRCPYGMTGHRLWVRETWATWPAMNDTLPSALYCQPVHYRATFDATSIKHAPAMPTKWRPSIFMMPWASRIALEVTGVRVERVQAITANDCNAEGCLRQPWDQVEGGPEKWYRLLWNDINMDRGFGWDVNPWVWVVEFKRI